MSSWVAERLRAARDARRLTTEEFLILVLDAVAYENGESMPKETCPGCGRSGSIVSFLRHDAERVRGKPVMVDKTMRYCIKCKCEFENSQDPDWRPEINALRAA